MTTTMMTMTTKNGDNDRRHHHHHHHQQEQFLVVAVVQPEMRQPDETPLDATQRVVDMMMIQAAQAAAAAEAEAAATTQNDIDLFVLPELCPVGYSEDTFAKYLPYTVEIQDMYRSIDSKMKDAARSSGAFVCYGTIGWKKKKKKKKKEEEKEEEGTATTKTNNDPSNDYEYFIRQNVVDDTGTMIATYDKIHLCDYGDCRETRFFTPGGNDVRSGIATFECHGWKLGLQICADIRHALLARRLVLEGLLSQRETQASVLDTTQVIVNAGCFQRDCSFRTWKSFRETRAVENAVYFVACNYAGDYCGESSVTPPWVDEHHEPSVMNNDAGILIVVLDKDVVRSAREDMPCYYQTMVRDHYINIGTNSTSTS